MTKIDEIPVNYHPPTGFSDGWVPDHQGEYYLVFLDRLHRQLKPKSYLEIGTETGQTLKLATCASIAIDPNFLIGQSSIDVLGTKPSCAFFQTSSDAFFADNNPAQILGRPIDLAFLDGMHRCEYLLRDFANVERSARPNSVIVMHDCLPTELPMAEREYGTPSVSDHRSGMWTGDVWRTVLALKQFRPDLIITAYDSTPTGIVCITGLNPTSTVILDRYQELLVAMFSYTLKLGIPWLFNQFNVEPTNVVDTAEKLTSRFWL